MRNKGVLYDNYPREHLRGRQRGLKPILQQVGISTSILVKMGKDEPVAMDTLAKICVVLDCTLDDIVELGSNTEKGGEWGKSMYRIMIVEDDAVIADVIERELSKWGFQPIRTEDFSRVLDTFLENEPHLVLMDISLPFYNGYYWCDRIRACSKAPVVFLSSHTETMDIVMAVNMGGDDYITKPVDLQVLIAKVQAMLRRSYDYEPPMQQRLFGAALDAGSACLVRDGQRTELTKNELRILQTLMEAAGQVVSREKLMLRLWDSDTFVDENTLTVNVTRLRKTLMRAGLPEDCIRTVKGQGYALRTEKKA